MEERIFRRKIYAQLLNWKQESDGKSALLFCFYNKKVPPDCRMALFTRITIHVSVMAWLYYSII